MAEILNIRREGTWYAVETREETYEISRKLLAEYGIRVGMEMEEEQLSSLHVRSRRTRAYQRALYLLDARDYSYSMLFQKLMQTYRDRELCTAVADKLLRDGRLDDARYARRLAEYLVEKKRYGIFRVRQELMRRGIPKALCEAAVEGLEEDARENIPAVLEKKYGRLLTDPADRRAREKAVAGMVRLGYDYRSVRQAVEDYFAELADDDDEE